MAILTLRVKGQTLTVESKIDKIVENSVNYLDCDIICDDENWNTLAKKIILKYDKIVQSLYGDKQVKIPFAAIRQPGFTISVIGYSLKEGKQESDPDAFEERITTHPVTIKVFASGPVEGQELEEPIIYATSLDSLGAAINKKIDIDNITQVIDNNSEESKVPSAKATYNAIADLKKDTIKIITGPCHIADLEAGIYMVKNDFIGEESDCRVTFSNVKADGTIYENYFSLESGLLIVFDNIKSRETDGTETSTVAFTAQGSMNIPNQYHKDVEDITKYTIENAISVTCYWLESTKYSQDTGSHKANKWYSGLSEFSFSDIPATAIIDEITPESTRYNIPSAVAIKNYIAQIDEAKIITKPCHIAELEAGVYMVKSDIDGVYNGEVTIANVKDRTIYNDYVVVYNGLLIVRDNIKNIEADGTEESFINFYAQGFIEMPNISEKKTSVDGLEILSSQHTFKDAQTIKGVGLRSVKSPEPNGIFEANKWYSGIPDFFDSDIPASAIKNEITTESTEYELPNAVAVRNYVNKQFSNVLPITTEKLEDGAVTVNKVNQTFIRDILEFVNTDNIEIVGVQMPPSKQLTITATLKKKLTEYKEQATDAEIYSANVVNKALADLEEGTIKTVSNVKLWELETGIYYVTGIYSKSPAESGNFGDKKHIYIIYKIKTDCVKYLHFCGNIYGTTWEPIECGISSGVAGECKEYQLTDTSMMVNIIGKDSPDNKFPSARSVYVFGDDIKKEFRTEINALKTELQGNINEISAVVGGA